MDSPPSQRATSDSKNHLDEVLRQTGAVRTFRAQPVPDHVLERILDTARFAPSGGNRQGWRVIIIKDHAIRRQLGDIYLASFREYMSQVMAQLVPWSQLNDAEAERQALRAADSVEPEAMGSLGAFALHFHELPVLLALLADLAALSCPDRDLSRGSIVGGASVYPFAWSLLLAAGLEGLGGVMTTMTTRREPEMRELLHFPPSMALAAILALGYPEEPTTRLRRNPISQFSTIDTFDGEHFPAS